MRNIEYPADVYDITADVEKNEIVVRVSHPGGKLRCLTPVERAGKAYGDIE